MPAVPFVLLHALDPLGHHALTCKSGGDLIVAIALLNETLAFRVSWSTVYNHHFPRPFFNNVVNDLIHKLPQPLSGVPKTANTWFEQR